MVQINRNLFITEKNNKTFSHILLKTCQCHCLVMFDEMLILFCTNRNGHCKPIKRDFCALFFFFFSEDCPYQNILIERFNRLVLHFLISKDLKFQIKNQLKPLGNILRKTIEGYLDSVPPLTSNTIKTSLIMHAFHSSRHLQSKWMLYSSHASMV